MDLAIAHAEDTLNRVNSYNQGVKQTSPQLQENISNMMAAYPTLPKEMAVYSSLAGIEPGDDLALQLAQKNQEVLAKKYQQKNATKVGWGKRGVQLGMLALDAAFQPISRGFKSAVVAAQQTGQSVPGTIAAATLGGLAETFVPQREGEEGSTTANFLSRIYNQDVGEAFKNARKEYGPTELNIALQQIKKGKPLNLGTGFLPNSVDVTQTQVYLDEIRKGSDIKTAYTKAADIYGLPVTQLFDLKEDKFKYTTRRGEQINISPGRIAAAQMLEPGSTGYSVVSGIIDGVFRIAADPVNLALSYGSGVKNAMRGMTSASTKALKATDNTTQLAKQFLGTFAVGKTGKQNRAIFYGKTIDDIRVTGWGQDFGKAIAKLDGNDGMSFLNDIPEFSKIPTSVKEVLLNVNNADHVWDVLEIVAKNGNLSESQYDKMFDLMKNYVPKKTQLELDKVRELTANNTAFGKNVIPYKPTLTGEFFNTVSKVITGEVTDVAPLRKFRGLFTQANPEKGLFGVGTQIRQSAYLPRGLKRSLDLRPETLAVFNNLDEAAWNVDRNLKNAFADTNTRGKYVKEVLKAQSQKELDEVINRVNMSIARSVQRVNPTLKVEVEDLIKQQQNFTAELNEVRAYFKGSSGGSLSFNGVQIKKKITKKIEDLEGHFKSLGIEYDVGAVEQYIFEAVPSMHLLSQAGDSFATIIDPQDVVRATKSHQLLFGPDDSRLRQWTNKFKNIDDLSWADRLKIPRRALTDNVKKNKLTLKPKTKIETAIDTAMNKVIKPAWMLRAALALRIAPEEALRAAFAGKINFITHPFKRMAMNSSKEYGLFGDKVRADKVFQLSNNLGEQVLTVRMDDDGLELLKNLIEVDDIKQFQSIDYIQSQKILKSKMLETNYNGTVSDYVIEAAVNNFDLRELRFAELTEKAFKTKTKNIKATAKGSIEGYDGKTYTSMGEAFIKAGGFTTDLDERKFFDLQTRKIAEGDAFVSPYKDKEFSLGQLGDIETKAKELNISPAEYIDQQIDNIFLDDDTVALLSKEKHVMGTYQDEAGNFMIDVSIGLQGENSVVNAVYIGANSFQESVYIANRELAERTGFGKPLMDNDLIYLYSKSKGPGYKSASDINIDTVLNQPALEALYAKNFEALRISAEDVQGAAKGMPGGSLFSNDSTYNSAMGQSLITEGLTQGRKDLAENSFIKVDKYLPNDKVNPRWWEAFWTEISLLASDPIAVPLANKGIDDTMKWLRSDGEVYLKELVQRSFNPEDKLYLTDDKALREYLESIEYRIGYLIGNPTAKILDPNTGKELSAEMSTRVWYANNNKTHPKYSTDMTVGANTNIMQFIKTGGVLDNRDWVRYSDHIQTFKLKERGKNNEVFYRELQKKFENEVVNQDLGAKALYRQFDFENRVSEAGTMIVGEEIQAAGKMADFRGNDGMFDNFIEGMYNNLISKPSNWLNRDPVFRYAFYENAIEVIEYMDDATKAKFLKGAEPWIDKNELWDELIVAAKKPSVENTITSIPQAEELLKTAAMNEVKTLFYSVSQRHVASDLFSNYIPFPEIWAEVFQSWGKLITESPQKFNRARITVDNGTEAKPWDSENGFLEKDAATGKLMFNYVDVFNVLSLGAFKGIGKLAEKAGVNISPYQTVVFGESLEEQGVRATAPGFAGGLNLIAQNGFAPGFGPTITIPMTKILENMSSPAWVRNFFLGEFQNSGAAVEQLPAWLKKLAIVGGSKSNDDVQQAYATTVMDLYTSYVLAGLVDQTDQASVDKYTDKAFKQANFVYIFRAAAQFSLPTAVQPRIEVEDKDGKWWGTQTLVNKYQEMLIRNGYDNFKTQEEFITRFGINPIPLQQASSYRTGKKPVKENSFMWWMEDDRNKLLEAGALPNTAYYIYPDKLEDELFWPAYHEIRSKNVTPEEYSNYMRQSQAIFEYEKAKKDIKESVPASLQKEQLLKEKKKIEQEYFNGNNLFSQEGKLSRASQTDIFNELSRWSEYDLTANSPEYVYVQEYLKQRDAILNVLIDGGKFTYKDKTLFATGRNNYSSKVLTGTKQDKIDAREIMLQIWQDLINDSEGTNFVQLANEVLFYELSPNNRDNIGD